MQEAYHVAGNRINERGIQAKKTHDRWIRSSVLQPGNSVLVRNLSERSVPGELQAYWQKDGYIILKRRGPNSPVLPLLDTTVPENLENPVNPTDPEQPRVLADDPSREHNSDPDHVTPTIPQVEKPRPQRIRHQPSRLTYYVPGDVSLPGVYPISATISPPVPYSPQSFLNRPFPNVALNLPFPYPQLHSIPLSFACQYPIPNYQTHLTGYHQQQYPVY